MSIEIYMFVTTNIIVQQERRELSVFILLFLLLDKKALFVTRMSLRYIQKNVMIKTISALFLYQIVKGIFLEKSHVLNSQKFLQFH